jgi:hypothetical protein
LSSTSAEWRSSPMRPQRVDRRRPSSAAPARTPEGQQEAARRLAGKRACAAQGHSASLASTGPSYRGG